VSVGLAVVCVAIAVVGAAVQGSIGLGFGLLASPFLANIDTDFIPGGVLVAVLPLSTWMAVRNHHDVDRRSAALAIGGRVPGAVLGAAVAAAVSSSALAVALAVFVLVAVAMSVWLPSVHPTTGLTVGAGAVSGFMGTATGVGGPPMALLHQRGAAHVVRATLSAYFAVGTVMSIVALLAFGDLTARQWRLGLMLIPGVIAGLAVSPWLRRHVDGPRFRPILLAVCAASAVVLLLEQL
jgi:uncharacterized membrane protein YfcA